jgi:hypothetical protein
MIFLNTIFGAKAKAKLFSHAIVKFHTVNGGRDGGVKFCKRKK